MFETKNGQKIALTALTIAEVNNLLQPLLPDLVAAMEACNFTDCIAYKAAYPFASPIINNGKAYLPLADGGSVELNSPDLPDALAQALSYNPEREDPLCVILSKNSEIYQTTGDIIMSHSILEPGRVLGIPRATDAAITPNAASFLFWNLNAGSRNLFTLSRTTSKAMHSKLQKNCGVTTDVPATAQEQWRIFGEIASYANSPWRAEILYFSRQFIALLKEAEYLGIAHKLQQIHRGAYNALHNTTQAWGSAFTHIERTKRLYHYSSYSLFTAQQLFLIAANSAPGFRPATTDDSAPIKLFQEIYTNEYGLGIENHSNVIMEPAHFNLLQGEPVYYALNYPTLARYNPETNKSRSLIILEEDVEHITRIYQESLPFIHPKTPSLCDVALQTKFTFYHCSSDRQIYKNILNSSLLATEDLRFTQGQQGAFAEHSAFFKGCIQIKPKC